MFPGYRTWFKLRCCIIVVRATVYWHCCGKLVLWWRQRLLNIGFMLQFIIILEHLNYFQQS